MALVAAWHSRQSAEHRDNLRGPSDGPGPSSGSSRRSAAPSTVTPRRSIRNGLLTVWMRRAQQATEGNQSANRLLCTSYIVSYCPILEGGLVVIDADATASISGQRMTQAVVVRA